MFRERSDAACPAFPPSLLACLALLAGSVVPAQEPLAGGESARIEALLAQAHLEQRARLLDEYAGRIRGAGALGSPATDFQLLRALELTPEEGVPLLREFLGHVRADVRAAATLALAAFGTQARDAIPDLRDRLNAGGEPSLLRAASARALMRIAPRDPAVIADLGLLLARGGSPFSVRLAVLEALASAGPVAREALPAVIGSLQDPRMEVRHAAFVARGEILALPDEGPQDRTGVAASGPEDADGGYAGLRSLRGAASAPEEAITQLARRLANDHRSAWACEALVALATVGVRSPEGLDVLLRIVGGWPSYPATLAGRVLSSPRTVPADAAVPVLVRSLADRATEAAFQAARLLAIRPEPVPEALEAVLAVLAKADGATDARLLAAGLEILRKLGRAAASAAPQLLSHLAMVSPLYRGRNKDLNPHLRARILVTLAAVGASRDALPPILEALDSAGMAVEFAAASRGVQALGSEGSSALPYLRRAFAPGFRDEPLTFADAFLQPGLSIDDVTSGKLEAIRAIAAIGPLAAAALPELRSIAAAGEEPFAGLMPSLAEAARQAITSVERQK